MIELALSISKRVDGWKLRLLGAALILIGVLGAAGVDFLPGVNQANAYDYILAGWGIIGVKSAIEKVDKSVEKTNVSVKQAGEDAQKTGDDVQQTLERQETIK